MLPLPNRYYRYIADYAIAYQNKDLLYDVYSYQLVREEPNAGKWRIYVYYDSDEDKSPYAGIGDGNFYLAEAADERQGIKLLDIIATAEKTMVAIMGVWERQKALTRNNPDRIDEAWKYLGREALTPYLDMVEALLTELPEETKNNYFRFALVCNYYDTVRAIRRYWLGFEEKQSKQQEKKVKKRTGVMIFQPKRLD